MLVENICETEIVKKLSYIKVPIICRRGVSQYCLMKILLAYIFTASGKFSSKEKSMIKSRLRSLQFMRIYLCASHR